MYNFISTKQEYFSQGIFEFTNRFEIKEKSEITINVYASVRYILYLNGEYVCEGPCRGSADVRYYDTIKTNKAKSGVNDVKLVVIQLTNPYDFSSVFKRNRPEILFHTDAICDHETFDKDWKCARKDSHTLLAPQSVCCYVPPFEEISANDSATEYQTQIIFSTESLNRSHDLCGKILLYDMQPRPIPMLYPMEKVEFHVVKQGKNFIELDAGKYVTAKPTFVFSGNADIKIIYAECYSKQRVKDMRDDSSGELNGPYDIVHTNGNDFTFTPFWFRAFRYIRIESENINDIFKTATAQLFHYPLDMQGQFSCSDKTLNQIYDISINTLLCCMSEIFVDCPHYEQQQYIMDSAIEANVVMHISNDMLPIKKCIAEFAASQQTNGLLLANYPSGGIQQIPGFSLFFIFLLEDYLNYSKDVRFAKPYVSVIDRIFTYFDEEIAKNGLISSSRYWDYVDWVPGWGYGVPTLQDNEPITIYNIYYAAALKAAERICNKCERFGLAEEYAQRFLSLKEKINSQCFDKDAGMYTDGAVTKTYSMHTIIWAILAELQEKDELKKLAAHLDDEGLNKSTFSMNFYLFQALKKCGMAERFYDYLDGWKKMTALHCTTWCENPDSPRSECHAWSSTPAAQLASVTLGVQYSFEDCIVIAPKTGALEWAKGIVPTRHGNVQVSWKIENNHFDISISGADGVEKRIVMPNGETHTTICDLFHASCVIA